MDEAFPDRGQTVLVVVEARAPEFADAAANALTAALKPSEGFIAVSQPAGGPFFEHNGLLFPSTERSCQPPRNSSRRARWSMRWRRSEPDRPRRHAHHQPVAAAATRSGEARRHEPLLSQSATTLDHVLADQPAAFSWRALVDKAPPPIPRAPSSRCSRWWTTMRWSPARPRRRDPRHRRRADLAQRYGATVRLTGEQPLADEEFASVQGRRRAQRHRHLHRRAGDSVARAAFGEA